MRSHDADASDEPIRRRLVADRRALSHEIGAAHVDVTTLALHAAGELPELHALEVTRHLAVCADGRCLEVLRANAAGAEATRQALYGPDEEPHGESPERVRTFQCREPLWGVFEQMAAELRCSVDLLIGESMKEYLAQRSYGRGATPMPERGLPDARMASAPPAFAAQPPPRMRSSVPAPPQPPPGAAFGSAAAPAAAYDAMSPANYPTARPPAMARGQGGYASHAYGPPAAPPAYSPAPYAPPHSVGNLPPSAGTLRSSGMPSLPPPIGAAQRPPLAVFYAGQRYAVDKDRYIIGRGGQSSDLVIKDPNVSRQHAMVEYLNGLYYMVDMGSTNGVDYRGERVARKAIAEGDGFSICGHEVRFSYR